MATIIATVNANNANSFITTAEADAYWESRGFTDAWDNADDPDASAIAATRIITAILAPRRVFVPPANGQSGYYMIMPTWTGFPATTTQALPWGRTGMYDRNGNAILSTVIPQELKDATSELAGQMAAADRLIDNDVAVQGITSVKAGSVAVSFGANIMTTKVLPDIVLALLVPSWLTDMRIEPWMNAQFDVVSS